VFITELVEKIKIAAKSKIPAVKTVPAAPRAAARVNPSTNKKLIAIGASTGGLMRYIMCLKALPPDIPELL
jgi:two-component system chemotaxis response regulator CheB